MSTNDYLPFAEAGGANVVTQATYLAGGWRLTGFLPGIADAAQANKVWRQASFMATSLATFVSGTLGVDALDDGNVAGFVANLIAAVGQTPRNARTISASTTVNMVASDYALGLDRSVGVVAMQINLPPSPVNGQEAVIDDLAGNFDSANVTLVPNVTPGGQTIAGRANYVMNESRGSVTLRYYSASNKWSLNVS